MERDVASATCIAQHIETFRKQAAGDAKADFGEPCQNCPMNKECNFDWLSNMAPLLKDSMVKIRMVLPVQCRIQDKIHAHLGEDKGNHPNSHRNSPISYSQELRNRA